MLEPFDITLENITYSVFPEEDNIYTIFKEGEEYLKMQKDEERWLKLDPETDLPRFEEDEELPRIGVAINNTITE